MIKYIRVLSCDCHEAWLAEGGGCRWMAPLKEWGISSPLAAYRKFAKRRGPKIPVDA